MAQGSTSPKISQTPAGEGRGSVLELAVGGRGPGVILPSACLATPTGPIATDPPAAAFDAISTTASTTTVGGISPARSITIYPAEWSAGIGRV